MSNSPEPRAPMAEAMEWVARITTVAGEMVLPGLAGHWIDGRLGTSFLVFLGFGLGLSGGIYHLLLMTRTTGKSQRRGQEMKDDEGTSR